MLSQLLAFEYDVLASTSMLSLILIWGDEANNCSVTKAYCCDLGAKYAFFVVVVMFALLGFNDSFFAVYNVHPLGLSRRTFTTVDAINNGGGVCTIIHHVAHRSLFVGKVHGYGREFGAPLQISLVTWQCGTHFGTVKSRLSLLSIQQQAF